MSVRSEPAVEHIATVPIRAAISRSMNIEAAVIGIAEPSWLGELVDPAPVSPGVRRVLTDLELPVRDGSAPGPIRKAALIDLGEPRRLGQAVAVSIAWQSATFAPLFPVFSGELLVTSDRIQLSGSYVPPFGDLGLVIDTALLRFIARRTVDALLSRIAAGLTA